MISKYLCTLKEARGYSNAKIAELSKVSVSTIDRIMSGKAKNTSFEVLRDITFALQGNMDDLARAVDATPDVHPQSYGAAPELPATPEGARELATTADLNSITDMFSAMLREKDANYDRHIRNLFQKHSEDIATLRTEHEHTLKTVKEEHERTVARFEQQLSSKDVVIYIMSGILFVLLVIVVLYFVKFDLLNGEFGFVRY